MKFFTEMFLAWRYFKPKRSAVSVITLISVIGVALGVCVLIVVLAVMTGFSNHLKKKLIETGSHGQLQKQIISSHLHPDGASASFTEEEAEEKMKMLKKHGAVEALAVLRSPVLLQVGESFQPKFLMAFDPAKDPENFPVRKAVQRAVEREQKDPPLLRARDFGKFSLGYGEILISSVTANEYKLQAGSKVVLHTQHRLMQMFKKDGQGNYVMNEAAEKYLPKEFTVAGVYTFDKYDFDKNVIFMGLEDADDICGLEWGNSTHIFFWTADPFRMKDFNAAVRKEIKNDPQLIYYSWEDMNRQFLDVLQVEKSMMFFLLIFIVLVAAFSITNTLITTVIQKTKEIGLLKSMGASSGTVMLIFVLQGAFVGILGVSAGILSGWLVVKYRMAILQMLRTVTGMEIFPKEMYLFSELPAHIIWSDVALIAVISIFLCTCGALIPAFRAARLDPAKALRYE